MLQLELSPEIEERLRQEAERRQKTCEAIVLQLLVERLPPVMTYARRAAALTMIEQWAKEDATWSLEAAEENRELLRMIDEDRPSHRKLFTRVLKASP